MSYPDIHTCIKLTSENEDLKKKLLKVKQQRDAFRSELREIKQKVKLETLLKSYVTTRESCTQTESGIKRWQAHIKPVTNLVSEQRVTDAEKTNRLIAMHDQVMRRYEKEVKQNLGHIDTITDLNVTICNLERQLKNEKEKIHKLELELIDARGRRPRPSERVIKKRSTVSPCFRSDSDDDQTEVNKLSKECHKLRRENKKLKEELKGLDLGFFEEIEDIKFSLQQSTKLNAEYERTLRKLCKKFGVPYPHPETNVK